MVNLLKTIHIKPIKQEFVINAESYSFGRLCSYISSLLQGKLFNICYSSHYGSNNTIILHNFKNIHFLGNKMINKVWYKHSGYIGGLKERKFVSSNFRQQKTMLIKSIWKMMNKCSKSRLLLHNSLFIYYDLYTKTDNNITTIKNIFSKTLHPFFINNNVLNNLITKNND